MTDRPSRFPVATLDDLPDDLRDRIAPIAERTGFIPNVFVGMSHRPDELRAFLDFHDALMERESGLTRAEREMIVVATSAANDCLYCVVAHGAILRIRARMNDLYVQYTGQSLSDIEKAMDRDTFLEAEEALKFGIVDKVFAHRPTDEEAGNESGTGGAPE